MAKNYLYNLLLTLANLLFPLLSFPYVSRMIGPDGIGKVQFAFSFAQYFAVIANIGVPIYGLKEIARRKNDFQSRSQIFSELITIHFLACFCLSAIYLGVIFSFSYFGNNFDMHLTAVLLILMGFTNIEWLYSGMEQFRSIALRSVLFKLIGLCLLYYFVRNPSDYRVYLYTMIFSFLGNNVVSLVMIGDKVKPVFSNLRLGKHIKPLLFILGSTLAVSMYSDMDTAILGFLSSTKTVGFYTAAVKLSKITLPFVTSMGVVLMPKIAAEFANNNKIEIQNILNKTFNFLVFFSVPVVLGLFLLAPEFITLFSGKEFLPATGSMQILSLLPFIIGFAHMFLYLVLIPSGKNREMFSSVLGGMAMSIILNILLVPHFKAIGSSIANVCSELVVTLLYVYFIRKYYRFNYNWWLILKSLTCALAFIPIIYFARQLAMPLIYTVAGCVATCGITYLLLQLLIFRNTFVFEILNFVKAKFTKVQA